MGSQGIISDGGPVNLSPTSTDRDSVSKPGHGRRPESWHSTQLVYGGKGPVLLAVLQDRCRLCRAHPGQSIQLCDCGGVDIERGGCPTARLTRRPAEDRMGGNDFQQPRANAGHPIEPSQAAECPVRLAIRNDGLGQAGTDLGQPGQLTRSCRIDIYPLTSIEWAPLTHGAVPLSRRRAWRKGGEKLDLAGGLTWPGGHMADPLTDKCQRKKKEQSAKLGCGHGPTVSR
jgi:hypothetical protein